jgi:hypothetical protein
MGVAALLEHPKTSCGPPSLRCHPRNPCVNHASSFAIASCGRARRSWSSSLPCRSTSRHKRSSIARQQSLPSPVHQRPILGESANECGDLKAPQRSQFRCCYASWFLVLLIVFIMRHASAFTSLLAFAMSPCDVRQVHRAHRLHLVWRRLTSSQRLLVFIYNSSSFLS